MRTTATLIALFVSVGVSNADTLHVPSQYPTIQDALNAAIPGDEVVIAPGIYKELPATNTENLTIRGAGPEATILSGDLDGTGSRTNYGFDFGIQPGNYITIQDIGFTEFERALSADGFGTVNIINCRFFDNNDGVIIWIDQGGPSLVEACTFENNRDLGIRADNSGDDSHIIRDCTFRDSYRGCTLENTILENCTIESTQEAISGSDIQLVGCTVESNSTGLVTTAELVVTDSVFDNNFSGGAIQHTGPCIISGSSFTDNTNLGSFGGAISVSGPELALTNSTFLGNVCGDFTDSRPTGHGAALNITCFDINIDNCLFESNVSFTTGAINASASGNATITNCDFVRNGFIGTLNGRRIDVMGGAFCGEQGHFVFDNCEFRENLASYGGALVHVNGSVFLRNSRFYANKAESSGGAIEIGDSSPVVACEFVGNSSRAFGAIGFKVAQSVTFPAVYNCTFVDNRATSLGAVMPVMADNTLPLYNSIVHTTTRNRNFVSVDFRNPQLYFHPPSSTKLYYGSADAGFIRHPSHGGDGWGDIPDTPDIDEGANDDFGDLRLRPNSPCIDAGDNSAIPADTNDHDRDGNTSEPITELHDPDGNTRFVDSPSNLNAFPGTPLGGPTDLGPYEFQPTPCLADVNNDGMLSPTDFTAWIGAYNASAPECDQNGDGSCTPTDFSAWIGNYNAGC